MEKRLTNIELLRIISMLMILSLHLLVFSGLLTTYNNFSIRSLFVWTLESICFVAVNCYVLISGYFLVDSNFNYKKICKLWITVFFYSTSIYIILLFTKKIDLTMKSAISSIFPISLGNYWFATTYIVLYILSPFLNLLIHSLNKKQYQHLLILIVSIFSIWATFIPQGNTINYGGSYSISWFICLYFIAGYLKIFYKNNSIKNYIYLLGYVFLSCINVLLYFGLTKLNSSFIRPDFLYNYYSITITLASICLFLFFKNIKIKNAFFNKLIYFFAPTTFGIYLIHENSNIRQLLWSKFYFIADTNIMIMILLIMIVPFILFFIFAIIDKIRILIFKLFENLRKTNKLLKISAKSEDFICQK